MNKAVLLTMTVTLFIISGCNNDVEKEATSSREIISDCGMVALKWQIYSRGFDAKEAIELATKLSLAAKADAENLKKIANIGAEAEVGLKSELSKMVNRNVKQESKVSEDFWEQENTYVQTQCLMKQLSEREDLTPEQRAEAVNNMYEFSKIRIKYMFESQKRATRGSVSIHRMAVFKESYCDEKNLPKPVHTLTDSRVYTDDFDAERILLRSINVPGQKTRLYDLNESNDFVIDPSIVPTTNGMSEQYFSVKLLSNTARVKWVHEFEETGEPVSCDTPNWGDLGGIAVGDPNNPLKDVTISWRFPENLSVTYCGVFPEHLRNKCPQKITQSGGEIKCSNLDLNGFISFRWNWDWSKFCSKE